MEILNMKQLRKQRGLTQSELAEKLNMTQAMLSWLENGKHFPKPETARKIEDFFGCQIDWTSCYKKQYGRFLTKKLLYQQIK